MFFFFSNGGNTINNWVLKRFLYTLLPSTRTPPVSFPDGVRSHNNTTPFLIYGFCCCVFQALQGAAVVRTTGAVVAARFGRRIRRTRTRAWFAGRWRRRRRDDDGRPVAGVVTVTANVAHRPTAKVFRRVRPVRRPSQIVSALRGTPCVHPPWRPNRAVRMSVAISTPPVELFHDGRERRLAIPRTRVANKYVHYNQGRPQKFIQGGGRFF